MISKKIADNCRIFRYKLVLDEDVVSQLLQLENTKKSYLTVENLRFLSQLKNNGKEFSTPFFL